MYDILTIGDIKLDTFILIPDASLQCQVKMPDCKLCLDYGKKNEVDDIELQIAGSAPNVAIALSKMKQKAAVYSEMGDDIIYNLALDFLKKNNVDTRLIKAVKGHDSAFAAVLNFKGESTQLVAHNGGEYRIPRNNSNAKWIHVSEQGKGYKKLYLDLIETVKKKGVKISFNPGTIQLKERSRELFKLLKHTEVLFLNRVETVTLLNIEEKEPVKVMLGELKKLGPKYVVMTDGKNGAYAYDGEQFDYVKMFPGERVEATGAGDAFASGFLGALMHNLSHDEALKWGSVDAASVVGEIGPTKGLLSHTQIKNQLRKRPSYKTKEL